MIQFSHSETVYETRRIIGDYGMARREMPAKGRVQQSSQAEPVLVFTGAIHGNEPSGVIALIKVFDELIREKIKLRGRVIGLTGNLKALPGNDRFISRDLNRIWNNDFTRRYKRWSTRSISAANSHETPEGAISEYEEQIELFKIIQPFTESSSPVYFVDLHTTSSRSVPFIAINDQLANRDFALQFPVPTVLGIEEYLQGPLLSYLNDYGHVALAFEAGQHDDPESVKIHTSFIYLSMLTAGVIAESQIPKLEDHVGRLREAGLANHGIFEVIDRKAITADDEFVMNEGFQNFDPINKNDPLARDRNGVVRAKTNGFVFMPLYQNSGNDGFFLVRRVPIWALKLSSLLRKINFERVLVWLPGITHDRDNPDALVVNKNIARFLAKDLFHLLGYRRKRDDGRVMIFSRREIDHVGAQ